MKEHPDVERFAPGEPIVVDVGNIERALGELWKQASRAGEPAASAAEPEPIEGAVTRAVLWNTVIPTRGRANLGPTKATIDQMAPALPTRAIILCLDDAAIAAELVATIESNVVSQPGGARTVYSEEITLTGPISAEAHFGALVRALQTPGVPTATFWLDPTLPQSLLLRELLPATNRLVLDTAMPLRPGQLFDLDRLAGRATPMPIADLGWLRLASLRSLFAGLFDPPVGGAPLQRASCLTVRHRGGRDASGLLIVAWLGLLLEWRPVRSAQTSDGGLRFDFERGPHGEKVEAYLSPCDGPCGKSGVLGIELLCDRDRFSVQRTALDQALVEVPIAPPKPVMLDPASDAELCAAALGPRGRDPLFARSLAYACRLWSLEPETVRSRR